ncbi:MAG: ATP phosphoribosyltransferase regulatory subunit [Planctomycetes bacterium]|nr:ATP phosphoribosyltransferase regulatory subunit [Planctomycetota bacterium]
MGSDAKQLSFPPGTELVFGPQAERRQFISDRVAGVFRGWGFTEIVLPAFDSGDTFEGLSESGDENELYHLVDREGRRLTLRADFTLIAAKALAMDLRREPRQIRASYEGRVYRFAPSGHGHRVEQAQRGLEWVNASGAVYDAAVVMMARECLQSVGADDAIIVVGHAGFIHAVLGEAGRRERRLLEALDNKNPSRIRQLAQRIGLDAETGALLEALPLLTGGPEVFENARKFNLSDGAAKALSDLEALYSMLDDAGAAANLLVDLGEVRRSDYYSGFMFKVYHHAVGESLGGGGRYDRLFDRFDMDVPAVGFGFNLARLAEATSTNAYADGAPESVKASDGTDALKRIREIRTKGGSVNLVGETT